MAEPHPAYQKIARLIAEREAAQLRARMAAQLVQVAEAKLAKAMTDAGLDASKNYNLDDEGETITLIERDPQAPP